MVQVCLSMGQAMRIAPHSDAAIDGTRTALSLRRYLVRLTVRYAVPLLLR